MRRREFLSGSCGFAVAGSVGAYAQQPRRMPRIGVLWHAGNQEEEGEFFTSFMQGFRDIGYAEGRTIAFEHRFANEQYDKFQSLAAELVALNVDVLVSVTGPATAAAQAATQSIPIVFVVVPDPIGNKFADSMARPGRNLTGLSSMVLDITTKRLELLKEAVPGLNRVALLVNPRDATVMKQVIGQVQAAAATLAINVQPFEAGTPQDIDHAFAQMAQQGMKAVLRSNDSMLFNERQRIANLAIAHRLPMMSLVRQDAQSGILMSYGPDFRTLFRRSAVFVDKIIKGEKPGDLPIEQPVRFELILNLKTAKALGIEIPLLMQQRADEVIE